jgi:hypothetical protein
VANQQRRKIKIVINSFYNEEIFAYNFLERLQEEQQVVFNFIFEMKSALPALQY